MLTRLGVAGWPVAHSLSPRMHNAALRAAGLDGWRYQHLPIPPERFAETVRALEGAGFRGINVTIPHKEAALEIADEATEVARAVGAANTLTFEDGRVLADNTDVDGLLSVVGDRAAGRRALVLGAGGAGRAAAYALQQAGARVTVWNRTFERAERLARDFGATAHREPDPAEITVNCTSVGLGGAPESLKELPLGVDTWSVGSLVIDMVYSAGATELQRVSETRGASYIGGLEILIGQGAASFERWTGRTAPAQAMREAVMEIA